MKLDFDKHRDVWGPLFVAQLRAWSENVYQPALNLQEGGKLDLDEIGELPQKIVPSLHPILWSDKGLQLNLLEDLPENYDTVKHFDLAADEYEMATHPFKAPITQEAFKIIRPYIHANMRVLDCGCGPGYETIALSMMVEKGEVIAADLSKAMIERALHNAKQHYVRNMGFFQADVHALPEVFSGAFDAVFCQLNIGYFDRMQSVSAAFYKVLRENGFVFMIEPIPTLVNAMSIDAHKAANPAFQRHFDADELQGYFSDAGFSHFYWKEILPGIGVSIIKKGE